MLCSLVIGLLVVQGIQELYLMTLVANPTPSDRWRFIKERYRIIEFQSQIFCIHRVMNI